jgi:hypothetical protein
MRPNTERDVCDDSAQHPVRPRSRPRSPSLPPHPGQLSARPLPPAASQPVVRPEPFQPMSAEISAPAARQTPPVDRCLWALVGGSALWSWR